MIRARLKAPVLVFLVGCGDCIPSSATTPASFAINTATREDVRIARSADEVRAALAGARVAFPSSQRVAGPSDSEGDAQKRLDAFVAETNFTTSDVALVRAGGERAVLRGMSVRSPTTLYYAGDCSPCGGGNPGSYEDALAQSNAAAAARTELVRVPKGARVVVHVCSTSCPACPSNVP